MRNRIVETLIYEGKVEAENRHHLLEIVYALVCEPHSIQPI